MRRSVTVLTALAVFLAAATLAASAAPHPRDADQDEAMIDFSFDPETSTLTWWFSPPDGEAAPECTPAPADPDEDGAAAAGALDEACNLVEVEGPQEDKLTHGSFVSSFTHSLKDLELDVPRGWLIRQIAHSELGKDDADPATLESGDDRRGPPAHANGRKDKPNKPKK